MTMDQLLAKVILYTGTEVAASTIRCYFNEYKKLGGFIEDGRGHWEREEMLEMLPSVSPLIRMIVKSQRYCTVELVTRLISEQVKKELDDDASGNLHLLLSKRGIRCENLLQGGQITNSTDMLG